MTAHHPLQRALDEWLPEIDFAVLSHGLLPHGRDYGFTVQAHATYRLNFTHVVEIAYLIRVADDVLTRSWDDHFTDYAAWETAGEPEGYVWGTNWSLAFPGVELLHDDASATDWSRRLGHSMFAARIETDRFNMRLVFHDVVWEKLSDDRSLIDQVLIPL
jgi:hypothetical protein